MSVTGACAEVIYFPAVQDPDYDEPVTYADLAAALDDTESVPADEYVDIDPRGDDVFSF